MSDDHRNEYDHKPPELSLDVGAASASSYDINRHMVLTPVAYESGEVRIMWREGTDKGATDRLITIPHDEVLNLISFLASALMGRDET